jgi:hypothetical protein
LQRIVIVRRAVDASKAARLNEPRRFSRSTPPATFRRMSEQKGNRHYGGAFGPLYEVRLGDLRAWHEARARCPRCRRDGAIRMDALFRRGDLNTRLLHVAQWLRCSGCGNRVGNDVYLIQLGRD